MLKLFLLNLFSMNHDKKMYMLGINIDYLHSLTMRSDIPMTNLFILDLESATIVGECFDCLVYLFVNVYLNTF